MFSTPDKDGNIDYRGKEIVVRFIEEEKAEEYEIPTPELIDQKLLEQIPSSKNHDHHTIDEFKKWESKVTAEEKAAVVKYTGSYYHTMNSILRKKEEGSKSDLKNIKSTQNALDKATLDKPIVLRRGIGTEGLAGMLGGPSYDIENWIDKNLDKINQGGYVCKDNAFLSMTPVKSGGFSRDVEVRMYCPSGTHAAYISSISNYKSEKETLLQSGSISRVVKIEKVGSKYIVYLELLGTD